MNWSKAAVSGRAPLAGSRHTATLVGDKLFIFGATDSGTFRDMHLLDIEALAWMQVASPAHHNFLTLNTLALPASPERHAHGRRRGRRGAHPEHSAAKAQLNTRRAGRASNKRRTERIQSS